MGWPVLSVLRCTSAHRTRTTKPTIVIESRRLLVAQEEYVSRQGADEELPLRWSAPEVLISRQHSSASDVWALGILFWEIFSNARTPYGALSMSELAAELNRGFRLPRPTLCPQGRQAAVVSGRLRPHRRP